MSCFSRHDFVHTIPDERQRLRVTMERFCNGATAILLLSLLMPFAHSSSSEATLSTPPQVTSLKEEMRELLVVFSDLDGTLIHYPQDLLSDDDTASRGRPGNRILKLPPSSTGLEGIISSGTLAKCRDLRAKGIKLVLVSGMRTATLLKRLPYLPRADAYCTEVGGRVFYPTDVLLLPDKGGFVCDPKAYDGAKPADLQSFGLREDLEWRGLMKDKEAASEDGYAGNEVNAEGDVIPVSKRRGILWQFASRLENEGLVVDTKGYSTCFRVNRKHQLDESAKEKFDSLMRGDVPFPPQLATSTNLGCVDFYPVGSGKKNW